MEVVKWLLDLRRRAEKVLQMLGMREKDGKDDTRFGSEQ